MTRDEFLKHAEQEIEAAFKPTKGRLMNLVRQTWAEGQKNAEVSGIEDIVKEAIEKIYDKPETKELLPHNTISVEAPDIHFEHMLDWKETTPLFDNIPIACRTCSNHPSNGGSGICHCIVGIPHIEC